MSHGPRSGERQKPGRNGPGGARHRGRSSRANQRPPASKAAAGRSPAARALAAIPSAPTVAQPNHGLTAARVSSRTRRRRVGAPGGPVSTSTTPPRRDQLARPREQRGGGAADPDVAVEQERRPPAARARDVGEHVAQDGLRAARPREPHGDRREVEPEPLVPGGGERREMAAGPAADVEHGPGGVGEDRQVGAVDGTEPAPERELAHAAAREPVARLGRVAAGGGRGEQPAVEQLRGLDAGGAPVRRGRAHAAAGVGSIAASAAAKRPAGAARATSRASAIVSTSRSGGSSAVRRPSAASRARWTAPVRAAVIGTPANTARSARRRPIAQ